MTCSFVGVTEGIYGQQLKKYPMSVIGNFILGGTLQSSGFHMALLNFFVSVIRSLPPSSALTWSYLHLNFPPHYPSFSFTSYVFCSFKIFLYLLLQSSISRFLDSACTTGWAHKSEDLTLGSTSEWAYSTLLFRTWVTSRSLFSRCTPCWIYYTLGSQNTGRSRWYPLEASSLISSCRNKWGAPGWSRDGALASHAEGLGQFSTHWLAAILSSPVPGDLMPSSDLYLKLKVIFEKVQGTDQMVFRIPTLLYDFIKHAIIPGQQQVDNTTHLN